MDYNYNSWNGDYFYPYELSEPGFQSVDDEYDSMFSFNEHPLDNNTFYGFNNSVPVGDPVIVPPVPVQSYDVIEESPAIPPFPPAQDHMEGLNAPVCFGSMYEIESGGKTQWPSYSECQIECPPPPPPITIDKNVEAVPSNNLEFKIKSTEANEHANDGRFNCNPYKTCPNDFSVNNYINYNIVSNNITNSNSCAQKDDENYTDEDDDEEDEEEVEGVEEEEEEEYHEKIKAQVNTRQVQIENYCNKKSICMSNVAKFSGSKTFKTTKGTDSEQGEAPKKKRTQTVAQIFERRKQTLWKMSDSIDMITGGK